MTYTIECYNLKDPEKQGPYDGIVYDDMALATHNMIEARKDPENSGWYFYLRHYGEEVIE